MTLYDAIHKKEYPESSLLPWTERGSVGRLADSLHIHSAECDLEKVMRRGGLRGLLAVVKASWWRPPIDDVTILLSIPNPFIVPKNRDLWDERVGQAWKGLAGLYPEIQPPEVISGYMPVSSRRDEANGARPMRVIKFFARWRAVQFAIGLKEEYMSSWECPPFESGRWGPRALELLINEEQRDAQLTLSYLEPLLA